MAVSVNCAPSGKPAKHHHAGSVVVYVLARFNPVGELRERARQDLRGRREFLRAAPRGIRN
jgi:hypothetical protein